MNQYAAPHIQGEIPVANVDVDTRATFISRTYMHLFGAIAAFTLIEVGLFSFGIAESMFQALAGGNAWLFILGGFMLVMWLGSRVAHRAKSLPAQYAALSAVVAAEALIFCPLLYIANNAYAGITSSAAIITLGGFAALTAIVFMTRKDFSFLGGILKWIGIVALAAIVGSFIFNYTLGTWFSVAMIAFAGGAILFDTSNVLHHYPEDRYVAASLELFTSVALLFWYVIRLLMALQSSD